LKIQQAPINEHIEKIGPEENRAIIGHRLNPINAQNVLQQANPNALQ